MSKFKDLNTSGKISYIGKICGSLMAIIALLGLLWNTYKNYSEEVKEQEIKELKEFIIETNKDYESEILSNAIEELNKTKSMLDSLHNVVDELKEGSEYFAIGFRGDGSGDLWYRDEYGNIYKSYYNSEYGLYYYIDEEGLAVYL